MSKKNKKNGRGWHGDSRKHSLASKKGWGWKNRGISFSDFSKLKEPLREKRSLRIRRANIKFLRDEKRLHDKYNIPIPKTRRVNKSIKM